jgi:fatty-acyl-CoA synthase
VRAPWVTVGYVGNSEASAALWKGGYLHTQDIGNVDESGQLHITDRMKDIIKSGGEWISSARLEELIARHPGVAEVAVIGIPDPQWGERPLALVVPRSKDNPSLPEELGRFVQAQVAAAALSKYAIPDRIVLVDQLEKTSVGKINKRLLRERYAVA